MSNAVINGAKIAGGAAWSIALRMCIRSLGLVSTIVLARLLLPADFGLVAMAMTVWSILDTILDLNIGVALITRQKDDRAYYDTAWTLSILQGTFIGTVLVLGAPAISNFFHDQRVTSIVYVYAFAAVISGFQNIGTVKFLKDLQLQRSFALGVATKLLSFTVTVMAAFIFRNYWALVLGSLTQRTSQAALSYVLSSFRPRLCLRKTAELISFSSWLMLNNVINALISQVDAVVMGRLASARSLGIYRIALEISTLPGAEIMAPARTALFPGFVRWIDDPNKLARNYEESLAVMASISLPIVAGICLVAEPLVRVLLGENWLDAVPIMRILVISAIVQILGDNAPVVFNALRRPHLNTALGCVVLVSYPLMAYYGVSYYGLYGAAYAHALTVVIYLTANTIILRRVLKASLVSVARLSWRTILATTVMVLTVVFLKVAYVDTSVASPILQLLMTACAGVAVFAGVHVGLWRAFGPGPGVEPRILKIARGFLNRADVPGEASVE